MADKFRKVDKEYILSDSTVNCYGYRLLTTGYQLSEYAKNPIGYYMHDREGGVMVRWEDLRVEGDCVYGKPCVNLSNKRGKQTLDEAESGFLNAASVGHIVVLKYSVEPKDMVAGQTGPTILEWYNRECSLVDIPGNSNALTSLYDNDGNVLKLADLMAASPNPSNRGESQSNDNLNSNYMNEVKLSLSDLAALEAQGYKVTDAAGILATIKNLKAEADKVPGLEQKIKDLNAVTVSKEVETILTDALTAKKITKDMKLTLAADYAANPTGLKALVDKMPAYQSVTDLIDKSKPENLADANWKWEDYEKNDPSGRKLKALMTENPTQYKALFDERFLRERE